MIPARTLLRWMGTAAMRMSESLSRKLSTPLSRTLLPGARKRSAPLSRALLPGARKRSASLSRALLPGARRLAERTLRLLISGLVRLMYRFRAPGIEHLPTEGAAVLVSNHISFVDALLIGVASRRPVRFVMDHRIFAHPLLHWLFLTVGAIPIAPRHEDARAYEEAFVRIAAALSEGELLCIFPEGKITHTGELNEFRRGVERILASNPVPVIPMALRGLWGSFFSRKDGPAMRKLPRRFRARVELRCGEAIDPHQASASTLQRRVQQMLAA